MGTASDEVADTARQIGRVALAALVVGVVVAVAGYPVVGGIVAAVGFVTYVATQYLRGRYS